MHISERSFLNDMFQAQSQVEGRSLLSVDDIKLDDVQKNRAKNVFGNYKKLLMICNIEIGEPVDRERVLNMSRKELKMLAGNSIQLQNLYGDVAKVRFSKEFNFLLNLLFWAERVLEDSTPGCKRIEEELKKMYVYEQKISDLIPFSEFKTNFDSYLDNVAVREISGKLDYDKLYIATVARWLMNKAGFNSDCGVENIELSNFRYVKPEVFNWIARKLFQKFLLDNFYIAVADNDIIELMTKRESYKGMLKSTDQWVREKRLVQESCESIFLEVSLTHIVNIYELEQKFQYRSDRRSQFPTDYIAATPLVEKKHIVGIELNPEGVVLELPIYFGLLTARLPGAVKIT